MVVGCFAFLIFRRTSILYERSWATEIDSFSLCSALLCSAAAAVLWVEHRPTGAQRPPPPPSLAAYTFCVLVYSKWHNVHLVRWSESIAKGWKRGAVANISFPLFPFFPFFLFLHVVLFLVVGTAQQVWSSQWCAFVLDQDRPTENEDPADNKSLGPSQRRCRGSDPLRLLLRPHQVGDIGRFIGRSFWSVVSFPTLIGIYWPNRSTHIDRCSPTNNGP